MGSVSLIVAAGQKNEIGNKNGLLWHLPDDFKWFKKHTLGHPVIMGRKTFESIGKPLPQRLNIIISRTPQEIEGTIWTSDPQEAIRIAGKEHENVFIIGGETIYRLFLPLADTVYLTRVYQSFEADAFFPELNPDEWKRNYSFFHPKDEKHAFNFEFEVWGKGSLL